MGLQMTPSNTLVERIKIHLPSMVCWSWCTYVHKKRLCTSRPQLTASWHYTQPEISHDESAYAREIGIDCGPVIEVIKDLPVFHCSESSQSTVHFPKTTVLSLRQGPVRDCSAWKFDWKVLTITGNNVRSNNANSTLAFRHWYFSQPKIEYYAFSSRAHHMSTVIPSLYQPLPRNLKKKSQQKCILMLKLSILSYCKISARHCTKL